MRQPERVPELVQRGEIQDDPLIHAIAETGEVGVDVDVGLDDGAGRTIDTRPRFPVDIVAGDEVHAQRAASRSDVRSRWKRRPEASVHAFIARSTRASAPAGPPRASIHTRIAPSFHRGLAGAAADFLATMSPA
jgi:hypothetical protein